MSTAAALICRIDKQSPAKLRTSATMPRDVTSSQSDRSSRDSVSEHIDRLFSTSIAEEKPNSSDERDDDDDVQSYVSSNRSVDVLEHLSTATTVPADDRHSTKDDIFGSVVSLRECAE